jgi:hypothetical protein
MSRHWLARDIGLVIALKLAIIVAASLFVFSAKQLPVVDEHALEERLMANTPAAQAERNN